MPAKVPPAGSPPWKDTLSGAKVAPPSVDFHMLAVSRGCAYITAPSADMPTQRKPAGSVEGSKGTAAHAAPASPLTLSPCPAAEPATSSVAPSAEHAMAAKLVVAASSALLSVKCDPASALWNRCAAPSAALTAARASVRPSADAHSARTAVKAPAPRGAHALP